MRITVDLCKDAISSMRYGSGVMKSAYWFIRVASILVPVFIIIIIAGVIYCKVKGIEVALPFF